MSISLLLDIFCATDLKAPQSPGNDLDLLNRSGIFFNDGSFDAVEDIHKTTNDRRVHKSMLDNRCFDMLMDCSPSDDDDEEEEIELLPNAEKKESIANILEQEISDIDFNLLKMQFMGPKKHSKVTITNDTFTTIRKQTINFRRVTLNDSSYKVGWVVDHDVGLCMCCGLGIYSFPLMMEKYHCRSCGNIVCDECSPYRASVPKMDETDGSIVCHTCFHDSLMSNFTQFQRYGSFDIRKGKIIDVDQLLQQKGTMFSHKLSNVSLMKKSISKPIKRNTADVIIDLTETEKINVKNQAQSQLLDTDEVETTTCTDLDSSKSIKTPLSIAVKLTSYKSFSKSPKVSNLNLNMIEGSSLLLSPKSPSPTKRNGNYFVM